MKKIIRIIILIFVLISLEGCYSYKEIDDSAIVSGIAIDKGKKAKYRVSVQIMNAKKKDEESISLITYYSAEGNTIYEAMQKMLLDSPKDLYEGHNEIILISETLAKEENPINYMDYFMRENALEKNSLVMLAKGDDAKNILKIITPLETLPSENLKTSLLLSSREVGRANLITADEFASKLMKNGSEVYLPVVRLIGDESKGKDNENIKDSDPDAKISLSTIAIFKNKKFYKYLTPDEAFALNILSGEAKTPSISYKCDENSYATDNISQVRVKKSVNYDKNMNVIININLVFEVKAYDCKINLINNKDAIKEVQDDLSKKVTKTVNKLIKTAYVEGKSDILGISYEYYKMHYKKYKKMKLTSKKILNNIKFKVKVKSNLDSPEFIIKSVKEG